VNDYPRFRPDVRVAGIGGDLVFLLGEQEEFLLRGRLYARLARLIDGTRSLGSLIEELASEASPSEICLALLSLKERGYLAENDENLPAAAFCNALGPASPAARERLARARASVTATSQLDPEPMIQVLASMGISVVENGASASVPTVHIVLADDYLAGPLNEEPAADGHRLFVKPTTRTIWFGPMLGPRGSCQACLLQRLRENRTVDAFVRQHGDGAGPLRPLPRTFTPSLMLGLQLAAVTAARWIASDGQGILTDHLITLDLAESRMEHHPVIRRPQCPVCGDPTIAMHDASRTPLVLSSRLKQHTSDGGHRSTSSEDTYERLRRHVDPITGFVTWLGPVASQAHTMTRLWTAAHPVCPISKFPGFHDFYVASWGKGVTDAQARVSALGEAIERRSAVFRGDEPRIRARFVDLAPRAIPPSALESFSERQYRERSLINAATPPGTRQRIPLPFDANAEIEWTPVWSLTHEDHRYVPTQYCYAQYPLDIESSYCYFHTNGNAAGTCLEEAILQGFLELVERDAVALWWYNRIPRPGVELDAFADPYVESLRRHLHSLGWRLWALDITSDFQFPAIVALAAPHDGTRVMAGFGCHLDAQIAVRRALTELYQCLDLQDLRAQRTRPGWATFALHEHPYLTPDPGVSPRTPGSFPCFWHDDLHADVRRCIEHAARAGIETLVLDQTRPEAPLHAVKVFAPGLRHFWPRLGPGRLYEVPVRLGWQQAPHDEQDLNPLPIFW
jgi:bacteriocin biosynthesis cyclodehydratase domain-containing protein